MLAPDPVVSRSLRNAEGAADFKGPPRCMPLRSRRTLQQLRVAAATPTWVLPGGGAMLGAYNSMSMVHLSSHNTHANRSSLHGLGGTVRPGSGGASSGVTHTAQVRAGLSGAMANLFASTSQLQSLGAAQSGSTRRLEAVAEVAGFSALASAGVASGPCGRGDGDVMDNGLHMGRRGTRSILEDDGRASGDAGIDDDAGDIVADDTDMTRAAESSAAQKPARRRPAASVAASNTFPVLLLEPMGAEEHSDDGPVDF